MNNYQRMVNYVKALPYVETVAQAEAIVAYVDFETVSRMLTPGQRRRIRHLRGGHSEHHQRQRLDRQERQMRKALHWTELSQLLQSRGGSK